MSLLKNPFSYLFLGLFVVWYSYLTTDLSNCPYFNNISSWLINSHECVLEKNGHIFFFGPYATPSKKFLPNRISKGGEWFVEIFETDQLQVVETIPVEEYGFVSHLSVSPDDVWWVFASKTPPSVAASLKFNLTISIYKMVDHSLTKTGEFELLDKKYLRSDVAINSKHLFVSFAHTLAVFDLESASLYKNIAIEMEKFEVIAVIPQTPLLLIRVENEMMLFDYEEEKFLQRLIIPSTCQGYPSLTLDNSGKNLFIIEECENLTVAHFYSLPQLSLEDSFQLDFPVDQSEVSADGQYLAFVKDDSQEIHVYNRLKKQWDVVTVDIENTFRTEFSADNDLLVFELIYGFKFDLEK